MYKKIGNYIIEERYDAIIGHYKAYHKGWKEVARWTPTEGLKLKKEKKN